MIQLPKHQIDGTNSGSRLKIGLTFGTLRKASWLVAKGLVIAEGPRTSRNLTGNALPVEVARRPLWPEDHIGLVSVRIVGLPIALSFIQHFMSTTTGNRQTVRSGKNHFHEVTAPALGATT